MSASEQIPFELRFVHAFEWCDCVFESGFAAVSVHAIKASAYSAMRSRLVSEAEQDREDAIRHGATYGPGWNGLRHKAWRVRSIEVQP